MKKLLMWSALLMTGFAFYSCDDVIDNPAQNDSTVWNCTVNVTFANFDFNGMGDPESGEPYAFEAPKKLYVFNEQLEPLGTIATNTPPSAGATAKYSGNLCGVIGDNLILTTKTGTDYAKQDGTIKSVVENGIVQTAKVGIRLYMMMALARFTPFLTPSFFCSSASSISSSSKSETSDSICSKIPVRYIASNLATSCRSMARSPI